MTGGFTVVTTMKNEGAFLLEWVAHYKALGFDHILICTNDCADPTEAMALRLQEMGLARHHRTRIWAAAGIQRSALKQARWYDEVTAADWIFVCDADEFLVVHDGNGSVQALAAGAEAAGHDSVAVAWRCFGPAGRRAYDPVPVTRQFTLAEADPGPEPAQATYGKSLFRGACLPRIHRIGIHRPVPRPDADPPLRFGFPGGLPHRQMGHRIQIAPDYRHAQVNHYALRSLESFFVKRDRGRVNHAREIMGADYWRRFDRAEVPCTAIRRHDAAVADWMARLMADAALAGLHAEAIAWHRDRIAALATLPDYAALAAELAAEGRV